MAERYEDLNRAERRAHDRRARTPHPFEVPPVPPALCGVVGCVFLKAHDGGHSWAVQA